MSRPEEPLSTIYLDGAPKTPFGGNVYVTPGKADGSPDSNPTAKDRTTSGTVGQDTPGSQPRIDISRAEPQTQFKFILRQLIGLSAEETSVVYDDFGITLETEAFSFSLDAWREMNQDEGKPLKQLSLRRLGGLHQWYSHHSEEYCQQGKHFLSATGI